MPTLKCVDNTGRCSGPFFEGQFLEHFNNTFNARVKTFKSPQVIFDFDEVVWVDLLELLSIVGAMSYISNTSDKKVRLNFTESHRSKKTINHLSASGFFDLINQLDIKVNPPSVS